MKPSGDTCQSQKCLSPEDFTGKMLLRDSSLERKFLPSVTRHKGKAFKNTTIVFRSRAALKRSKKKPRRCISKGPA